jgi:hypothetical protein
MIFDALPKYRINRVLDESKMKFDLTPKYKFSDAIDIDILEAFEKAEPSIN